MSWSRNSEKSTSSSWVDHDEEPTRGRGGQEELTDGMSQLGLENNSSDQWNSNSSTASVGHGRGMPRQRQDPGQPGTAGRISDFFSFGSANSEMPYVPPMRDRRPGLQRGRGIVAPTPGLTVCLGVDPEKVYVGEYKTALDKRIQEISERQNLHDESCGSSQSVVSRSMGAESGRDTSLLGTVIGRGAIFDQDDDVWDKYDMNMYNFPASFNLAVYKHKEMIMATLKSQQVMIVEGFTGCGKTTQIPQFILNDAAINHKRCNIVVTQPRRIAALSVAERVAKERGWELGSLVGYQVGLNRRWSPDTRLNYMTTGILLQTLISRKRLDEYTHIIVDEVHERDLETDLLLLVIKKIMVDQADKLTKVILMSATLNATKFADYFPKWKESVGAGIVRVPPDAIYPVTEYYLDTIPLFRTAAINLDGFDEPKLHQECYDYAMQIISSLDALEEANRNRSENFRGGRGGVLVFLPGMMEIDHLFKVLREFSLEQSGGVDEYDQLKWLLLPLHSLISGEDQQKVFQKPDRGYRKIILATNIAESSITVSDITYVIDFCLTKSLGCDPATNYSCLRLEWASKNQCTQRKGRVGRVGVGVVYRMVPIEFYHGLREEALPDMEKACLENVVLDVKNLNLGSPKSILALSIDPPKLNGIRRAVANLKEVGALSITVGSHYTALDGDMTKMGHIMAKLPFDIRLSRLIVLGHVFGVLEESVIIAAGLSVKSPFSYPFHRRLEAFMSKLSWAGETYSDCFAILSLYRTWRQKHEAATFRTLREERIWAKSYFIQINVMKEMNTLIMDITRRLQNVNIDLKQTRLVSNTIDSEQGLLLKVVIAGAFYPNYFIRHRPVQKDYEKNVLRELAGYNPLLSFVFNGFPMDQPGELYAECIARYFMSNECIPRVHFSSSKVIVFNDPQSPKVGLVSQNVYRGIKMRQIRESVIFGTLSSVASKELMRNELDRLSKSNRIMCPEQVPLPPITTETIDVVITHFVDIETFWCVYEKKYAYLSEIAHHLKSQANALPVMSTYDVVRGALCIAEDNGEFYRARIEFFNGSLAFVYCIDHGKSLWRRPNNLLGFNDELLSIELNVLEQQAIQCRIYGVKPLARYSSLWGQDTKIMCEEFISLFNQQLTVKIYSIVESVISCDLIGDLDAPTLREALLEDGKAAIMEEPRTSRENNNARYTIKKYKDSREEKANNERQIKRETLTPVLATPTVGQLNEVILRGPFSPLEMSFTSLCRSAHMKQVQVEGNSVNSVALDQEPMSGTARLLIAAGVGISQRSGNVMAKDATLMPAIPGLVGLLTMIFCPKLELRYNQALVRYTGCLSGLGVDPHTNEPVYGDHDVEIVFDTMFDNEDLNRINSIRMSMNLVLCNDSAYDIQNLRASVRKELQDLLEREREPAEEEYPSHTHCWGLLPPEQQTNRPTRGSDTEVFPSHRTVDPNEELEMLVPDPTNHYNSCSSYDWKEEE